ncbi:MAG: hypothetical protein JWP97_2444 [Labilithrix sp.]|nr:hypothetical protein [Labilithrix sp.]
MTRGARERIADVRRIQRAARAALADREALVAAIVESTALSPEGVALALDEHLELEATDEELTSLVARAGDAPAIAVVLSANVFVGALRALAIARAASTEVRVRPSRRDPAFARALVAAMRAGGDLGVVLDEALDVASVEHGEIHVYGRDETIADVHARARPGVRVRGHGSGLGVAWVSARADLTSAAASLARDVVVFDQRGCLSPRAALVEGDEGRAVAFATALHEALEELTAAVPRGALPGEERAAAARYVATMTYAGRAFVGTEHAIGVAPPGAPLVLPPPYRHLHVAACEDLAQAMTALGPWRAALTVVGSDDGAAARALAPTGIRVAALGFMQRPALDGPVDLRDA